MRLLRTILLVLLLIPLLVSCGKKSSTEPEVPTCADPVFTPVEGTYSIALVVSITCATAGATIFYTLDGSEPDYTSAIYSMPFQVPAYLHVKAKAVKSGYYDSNTIVATFRVYEKMVSVTGGTFNMGRTTGTGDDDELPVHAVTVSSFYMSKYEISQSDWFNVMGSNPSYFVGDANRPVESINWYSTLVYCNKRSLQEGLTPVYTIAGSTNPADWGVVPNDIDNTWNAVICNWTSNGYRLPTEAEWEFAARGGVDTPDYLYAGSNTANDVAWYTSNALSTTHPVGTKQPNGLGIYDMSGNVAEFCWDWHSYTYYQNSPSLNPHGVSSGNNRVVRGGAYAYSYPSCQLSARESTYPYIANTSYRGFRVVRNAID